MERRTFLALVSGGLLAAPLAAGGQPAVRQWRIGYLSPVSADASGYTIIRQSLRDLGYVESQNVVFDEGFANGVVDRLPGLAAALVRRNPDVIVAASPPAIRAARAATKTIPIVIIAGDDPVRSGFVSSLARPGGNITGVTFLIVDLFAKQMELLIQVVPHLKRVAFLWDPTMPTGTEDLAVVRAAAESLGLLVQIIVPRGANDYAEAFAAMTRGKTGGLIIAASPTFIQDRGRIVGLAAKHRLPGAWAFREDAAAGGLLSYGPSQEDSFRLAATYVDKILRGATPATLPVEQPTKFELVINLKTAKALGLTIPQSLLLRADQVIE